jgi:two-component system sensor histidine kinase CpxA
MDIRGKLFTKILLWFFLNLALIGVLVWGVQALQLDPGAASTKQDEFRVQAAAKLIADELIKERRENWDAVLQRHADLHQVAFVLLDANGTRLAGPALQLPEPVKDELRAIAQRRPPRRPNPNNWIYNELSLREKQISQYESARREREQAYRAIWNEPGFRELPREERDSRFHTEREKYTDKITAFLNEEQQKKYTNIVQRFSRISTLLFRRPGPQLSPDRLSQLIAQADANHDGQLTTNELRNFFRIPPGSGKTRPAPPPSRPGSVIIPPLRTANPTRHWAGVEIPVRIQTGTEELPEEDLDLTRLRRSRQGRRGQPPQTYWMATLLTMSESGGDQGLFAEPLSWVPIVLGTIGLSALFWLPMVRNITRPIAEITAATEQIAEGKFDTRVGTERTDEIGRVGQAVDHMAARLDGFVKGQRRFLGDISHELCSPIARIQVALGILDQRADTQQKKYVQDVQDEVEHMSELVNELLLFSQEGVNPKTIELKQVNLREVIDQIVEREGDASSQIKISVDKDFSVIANSQRLSLALGNLVRNAVQYASDAGPISVSAKRENESIIINITDNGPGLSEECLPRIFDPLYRPELSRGRDTGGVGLGLAIVKTCVEACNGTVVCRNREPSGLEFTIHLDATL